MSGVSQTDQGGLEPTADSIETMRKAIQDADGQPASEAFSLADLRTQATRLPVLHKLLWALAPKNVNPKLWIDWMSGKKDPFKAAAAIKPTEHRSSGKALERQSGRVEGAKKALVEAEQRVEAARQALVEAQAVDSAILQWRVGEELVGLLGPMFAMGPAWTLMRAVTAHMPEDQIDYLTGLVTDPVKKARAVEKIHADRSRETAELLRQLDLWCGDAEFEGEIRKAVAGVCTAWQSKENEAVAAGRRLREDQELRTSIRPAATTDRTGVLDGLAGPT